MSRSIRLAAFVVIVWGAFVAKPFLVPLCLAILLCFLVLPLLHFLVRHRIPEWAAVAVSSFTLCLPVVILTLFSIRDTKILVHDFPQIMSSFRAHWAEFVGTPFIQNNGLAEALDLSVIGEKVNETAAHSATIMLEVLKSITEASAHLLLILFFSVLMLASRKRFHTSVEKLVKNKTTLDQIITLIEKFLLARMGIAILVIVIDLIILNCFGTPYSFLLAILLGLSTAIPILGFIAALVPVIIVSLSSGHEPKWVGLMVVFLYLVATTESHFLSPKYLGKQLNLNLLATFLGLFAGELLWGIWGMVLAIPMLGIARIILSSSDAHRPWARLLVDAERE